MRTETKNMKSSFNNLNNFKLFFTFAAICISFSSTVTGQFQVSLGASNYSHTFNKDELNYNIGWEYSTQYRKSRYLTIGFGYLFKENILLV
jgi:hypothetical protein